VNTIITRAACPLVWITGLPGSGKSTLANQVVNLIRLSGKQCVLLDGDTLREILGKTNLDSDYSMNSRKEVAMIYSKIGILLNSQGVIVVVSTVSLFWDVHEFNRQNLPNYCEVFLDVDLNLLYTGQRKHLYESVLRDSLIPEFPKNPDIILRAKKSMDREKWLDILRNKLIWIES
jgi:adenylylsulfate kinase-like enzyme